MKEFNAVLQKRLAQKNMSKLSIGAFLLQSMKKHVTYPESLSGYLRWNVLVVKLSPKEDKTMLFMKRKELCNELNALLQNM